MGHRPGLTRWGLVLALLVWLSAPALAAPGQSGAHARLYYVSLGTSLSVGIQPDATGTNQLTDEGYADQLHAMLVPAMPNLGLVKLGCPGETTVTMIQGGICTYPTGSQLAQAVSFLHAHRRFVALVTIDMGANDLLPCADVLIPELAACVGAVADAVVTNLPVILTALREASGPDVPIIGMNYYNPFLVLWFQDPTFAMAAAAELGGFNGLLGAIYGSFGIAVADVAAAFHSDDFATLVPLPGFGLVPLNVALICAWTWMCAPDPIGPNIHANAVGYGVIAGELASVAP